MASPGHPPRGKTNVEKRAKCWYTPEDVDRLKRYARKGRYVDINNRDYALIVLAYDTGLRRAELTALDVDNLHLDASPPEVYLQPAIQKGRNPDPAYLDISQETAGVLEDYLDRRPWHVDPLFPSREAERAHPHTLTRAVRSAARRGNVRPYLSAGGSNRAATSRGDPEDVGAHALRHSVAYRMIRREGKRMVDVQLRLRHAELSTTEQVYGHLRRR